jgi:hypothetical protein
MDKKEYWTKRILIWEGLDNFRQVLKELFGFGIKQINQASLDQLFGPGKFKHISGSTHPLSKNKLLESLEKEKSQLKQSSSKDKALLEEIGFQEQELNNIQDELIIERQTEFFQYDFIFREENLKNTLSGFAKIRDLKNSSHVALLGWQDNKAPILFLAEIDSSIDKMYFHVNFGGSDGFSVIEENENYYLWTQWLKHDYQDLVKASAHGDFGTVRMSKLTGEFATEEENLAAANALAKANARGHNDATLLENNVALMHLYKVELQRLIDLPA